MTPAKPESLAKRDLAAIERIGAAQEQDTIDLALMAARERLGMDVAYMTTVGPRSQEIDEVSGDSSALGFGSGSVIPLEETYCSLMLKGDLPNVVPDTRAEPAVRDLNATARIAAYVGVPIELGEGRVHGTLCAASSEPRHELGAEELEFMRVLANMVAGRIEKIHGESVATAERRLDAGSPGARE